MNICWACKLVGLGRIWGIPKIFSFFGNYKIRSHSDYEISEFETNFEFRMLQKF